MKKLFAFLIVFLMGCGQNSSKEKSSPKESENSRTIPVDFTLTDINGNVYTLSKQKDKVVFLNFWATWCAPCKIEIPELIALYNRYKTEGLLVLGIALDKENAVKRFAQNNGISYPVLIGNEKIAKDYRIQGIPATYIIDKKGKIAFYHVGFAKGMEKTLEEEITTLLKED